MTHNSLFAGKVYYHFDELSSTNDWTAELLAKSKPPEGTVVRADRQTAGRGQFGSHWISQPGRNLLLSIVLYPQWLAVSNQFYLSMCAALALHDAVEHPEARLKWPNDLYIGNQKVAGILIQNAIGAGVLQSAVVGIGLNVNQTDFVPELPNPGSLALACGKFFDLDEMMTLLCLCLEHRYLQLKSGDRERIHADYEAVLYRRDETTIFETATDGSRFQGMIRGVAPNGFLKVETTDGALRLFDLKELKMVG